MNQGFKLQFILVICFSLALSPFFVLAATLSNDFTNRQKIFYKVMDLSQAELQNLNKTLNNLKIDDNSLYVQKKDEYLKILSQFEAYNNEVKDEISKAKNVSTLKSLAIEFKNWREKTYNPQAQIIVNFSLVLQQKEMLATTNDRLAKIQIDVKKLENLGIDQINKLNSLLDKSTRDLNEANQSFEKAKSMIDEYFSASSTKATSTMATTTKETATSTENATSTVNIGISIKQIDLPRLQLLLEEGFSKIKSVYETFLEMSSVVKKL